MKKLTGLLVFVAAVAGAFAVSRYFSSRREIAQPPAPPVPAITAEAPPAPGPGPVFFKTRLATLDFGSRKSHLTLALERDRSRPEPERIWVTGFFFSSAGGGEARCLTGPVELRRPFADGDRATVTVTAPADDCPAPRTPSDTFYVLVQISDGPAGAARPPREGLLNAGDLTPVVVEGARGEGR